MFEFTFVLDLPSLNEVINANRTTRTVRKKNGRTVRLSKGADQKKQYTGIIAGLVRGKHAPVPQEPLVWVFQWVCEDKRTDPDNITVGAKFILDGLQEAGIIEGDGWRQVGAIIHTFEVGIPARVRVTARRVARVTLTGVDYERRS